MKASILALLMAFGFASAAEANSCNPGPCFACEQVVFTIPDTPTTSQTHGSGDGVLLTTTQGNWTESTTSGCWEWGTSNKMEWRYTCNRTAIFRLRFVQDITLASAANTLQWQWLHDNAAPLDADSDGVGIKRTYKYPITARNGDIIPADIEHLLELDQNDYVGIRAIDSNDASYAYLGGYFIADQETNCDPK